ncbi:MAG: histidinol dehydrogenase [Bacteroidota bacterium]|jgi:histidinol dehydrogenase
METIYNAELTDWNELAKRPTLDFSELELKVQEIISKVVKGGDKALIELTYKFDDVNLVSLKVSAQEFENAKLKVDEELKQAIHLAKKNIELFHEKQFLAESKVETAKGVTCWRKSVPIQNVGFYIPGGSAPLFSTLLMLGVPALIAGCKSITVCTPADKEGNIHPAILFAADLLGIKNIYKIGGAQAITAMAFGTESIPKADKLFGPGNQYVTCAKQLLANKQVAIDMPAGPSELAVIADESCIPSYVAADLLSQAEHGPDSQVVLISNCKDVIQNVKKELDGQLNLLPRKQIAERALTNSKLILVQNLQQAIDFSNFYAPEHLIIAAENAEALAEQVLNAGSVFIGNFSCESAGDYASGTNHTLPTNGFAKAYSGVSVDSFVKKITFQNVSPSGLLSIGNAIEIMAQAEGLDAHKNAVTIRLKDILKKNGN